MNLKILKIRLPIYIKKFKPVLLVFVLVLLSGFLFLISYKLRHPKKVEVPFAEEPLTSTGYIPITLTPQEQQNYTMTSSLFGSLPIDQATFDINYNYVSDKFKVVFSGDYPQGETNFRNWMNANGYSTLPLTFFEFQSWPVLYLPLDEAVVNQGPELIWSQCTDATKYKVNITGPSVNWTSNPLNSNLYTVSGLTFTSGSKYTWKVRCCFDNNCTAYTSWSTPRDFWWQVIPTVSPSPTPQIWKVFNTSTTFQGNLGGLSGADLKCQTRAGAANLPGMYKAWLSTSTIDAKSRIQDGTYAMVDNTIIANSKADLIDYSIDNNINKDEFGNTISSQTSYTGTKKDGTRHANTCNNWASSNPIYKGETGYYSYSDYRWTDTGNTSCDGSNRLYCFQTSTQTPSPTPTPIPTATPTPIPTFKVFVSSVYYLANLGGLTGADNKCQTLANNVGLTGSYKAWLSTTTIDAKDRIPEASYKLVDGTIVANNKADLLDGSLDSKIYKTESGNIISNNIVFTGSNANGTKHANNCNNWSTTNAAYLFHYGNVDYVTNWWIDRGNTYCNHTTNRLYCFQTSP